MKLHIFCSECFKTECFKTEGFSELLDRLHAKQNPIELFEQIGPELLKNRNLFDFCLVNIRDDGIYELTCPKGHVTFTLLQQLLFEILFDIGAYAITDGYYREAISSFTASLERFYEFYIKVILLKYGVDNKIFNDSWKHVSNMSERQLGAYIFLYTIENKTTPQVLDEDGRRIRNDVIHKGKIPSKEKTIEYGNKVLRLINPVLYALKKQNSEYVQAVVSNHFSEMRKKLPIGSQDSCHCETTIISISNTPHEEKFRTLEEEIESIEIRKKQYL